MATGDNIGIITVDKTSTIDARRNMERLAFDVTAYTRNEIIHYLREITGSEVLAQTKIDNPPTSFLVDGRAGKSPFDAVRRVVVLFGNLLPVAALNAVMQELMKAIKRSTGVRTGALSSPSNWEWVYVNEGKNAPVPAGGRGIPMGPNSFLVLKPVGVPHATIVNMWVGKGRGKRQLNLRGGKGSKGAKGGVTAKNQGLGFLAYAARSASRNKLLAGFKAVVRFSQKHKVAGEISTKQGSGGIMIKVAKLTSGRRR